MKNKKILYIFIPVAGVLIAMILFLGSMAFPQTPEHVILEGLNTTKTLPVSHKVENDETIYDIAKKYEISPYMLILENKLNGELPLTVGQTLFFPKERSDKKEAFDPVPDTITISANQDSLIAPVFVKLTADMAMQQKDISFVWDFGNNRFSFDPAPTAKYIRPGVFTAKLIIRSKNGFFTVSNSIEVNVDRMPTNYTGLPYVTTERIGDLVLINDLFKDEKGNRISFDVSTKINQKPALVEFLDTDTLIARDVGFSHIKLQKKDAVYEFYLWVSPIPSRTTAEPEYDWYLTQFDTGMYGNCGPAGNASVIGWAIGHVFSVEKVREQIGLPIANGAVSYDHLLANIKANNVPAEILEFENTQTMMDFLDDGKLILISFHCGMITPTEGPEETDYIGRFYPDSTGHYLVIKGYTLDKKYFVVYDAIPGEWDGNKTRYADGVSMIGRNRLFRTDEVFKAMRKKSGIVASRSKQQL